MECIQFITNSRYFIINWIVSNAVMPTMLSLLIPNTDTTNAFLLSKLFHFQYVTYYKSIHKYVKYDIMEI